MQERLEPVITNLQSEEATLLERRSALTQQVEELDASLKQVRGALAALGVQTTGKASGRRAAKPSPDRAVVREVVLAALDGRVLQADQLRSEVEQRLQERGYSRMGLALRLKEVLGEPEFAETPEGYRHQPHIELPGPSGFAN